MKKVLLFLCLFLVSMTTVFAESAEVPVQVSEKKYTIAVIPYLNTTEEKAGYINDVIQTKYNDEFSKTKFTVIPEADVLTALNKAGYDVSNMELPEKGVLASVAKETNADYVVAMEISQRITTRHMSFFSTKAETKAKLRYKFYDLSKDKLVILQTTGDSENTATLIGNVGYKAPITNALNKAMDAGYVKITSNL